MMFHVSCCWCWLLCSAPFMHCSAMCSCCKRNINEQHIATQCMKGAMQRRQQQQQVTPLQPTEVSAADTPECSISSQKCSPPSCRQKPAQDPQPKDMPTRLQTSLLPTLDGKHQLSDASLSNAIPAAVRSSPGSCMAAGEVLTRQQASQLGPCFQGSRVQELQRMLVGLIS